MNEFQEDRIRNIRNTLGLLAASHFGTGAHPAAPGKFDSLVTHFQANNCVILVAYDAAPVTACIPQAQCCHMVVAALWATLPQEP